MGALLPGDMRLAAGALTIWSGTAWLNVGDLPEFTSRYHNTAWVEQETPQGTTSATLVDVPGVTATITLASPSNVAVFVTFTCQTQSGGGPSVLGLAVNFDGVDEQHSHIALSGAADTDTGGLTHRTDSPLAAGSHTVKLRFHRDAGASTPGINRADMLVMAC